MGGQKYFLIRIFLKKKKRIFWEFSLREKVQVDS